MKYDSKYTYRVVNIFRPENPPENFQRDYSSNHPDSDPYATWEVIWPDKKYHSYSGAYKRVTRARLYGILQRVERAPLGEWETLA